jgi:hypothetical protein
LEIILKRTRYHAYIGITGDSKVLVIIKFGFPLIQCGFWHSFEKHAGFFQHLYLKTVQKIETFAQAKLKIKNQDHKECVGMKCTFFKYDGYSEF